MALIQYVGCDKLGQAQVYEYHSQDETTAVSLLDTVVAHSLAGTSGVSVRVYGVYAATPTLAGANLIDCATLSFATAAGYTVRLTIPAARTDIYTDGKTVDPTAIADIIAVATGGALQTGTGQAAATYISGKRVVLPVQPYNRRG